MTDSITVSVGESQARACTCRENASLNLEFLPISFPEATGPRCSLGYPANTLGPSI